MMPYPSFSDPRHLGMTYSINGITVPADFALWQLETGAAAQCPNNDCGPRSVTVNITHTSGRRESYTGLVNDPFFNVNVRYTGAAAGAAAEQFSMGMADGGGFGAALLWSLVAGDMLAGRPIEDSANHFATQHPTSTPQQNSFADCAKQAGVEGTGFNEDAANLVSRISASEGTASELLAYTWMKESSFQMNPVPNTNNSTDTGRWDYGPFQLNAYWIGQAIKKGQVSTDGINIGDALGGHSVKAGQLFAGDVFENGRLAARYLNSLGTGAKAAGLYTGGTRTKERSKGFNEWEPKFQAFFNCFKR